MTEPTPRVRASKSRSAVLRGSALAAAASFVFASGPALPQQPAEPRITGVVTGEGFTPIRIALPSADAAATAAGPAQEIVETLRDDLRFAGFFDIVDPSLYRLVHPPKDGAVSYDEWRSIGAETVVLSRVAVQGARIDLEARLYDNPSRTMVFARRYGGGTDLARRVAHQLADDLVRHFTGRPGVALSRIAFCSKHGDGKEIYLMDYDGRRLRRLTTSGTLNLSPAWSPDGERLTFVSWRTGRPAIFVMDDDGRTTRVATAGGDLNSAPAWSPDGRKIVYNSDANGNSELYVAELGTGRNTRLTHTAGIETSPAFSPNGREIAFTSDRSGSPQVYIMDAEGLNARRVSAEGDFNDSASWSPQGDRLAYVSRREGRFDVVVLNLATGVVSRLTHGEGSNEDPRWASDGRHLVFASNRTGSWQIHTMSADGTDVRQLTRGSDSYTPDWSR
jgi:TolB protein